jgi:predicted PurR-regulated permease PerM
VGAYIGAGLGFLLIVMVDPVKALGFIVFIIVLQQIEGNLIYPKVVGDTIGLPGIWVFAAIIVGGGCWASPASSWAFRLLPPSTNCWPKTSKTGID